jgi:GTPase SAR1 family protein
MAANGSALDAGQASLVRQMCTSGARLQLAIAPAGAGKTTAMRALTLAWTQDGGHMLGLAPSAAAAAVLAEQTGIRSDTLAKLTWSLRHGELPDWAAAVGRSTLLIIDEAGMADTSPSTPPSSSPSVAVQVSDWSEMINNWLRSAPAVSSATSPTPTAPSA